MKPGQDARRPDARRRAVADGTAWIGIADIADVCGALLGQPAA